MLFAPSSGTVVIRERKCEVILEKKSLGKMRTSNIRIAGKETQAKQQASSISVHTVTGT